MTAIAFVLAIVAALGVLLARRILRQRRRRAALALPGRAPYSAIPIERFDQIDAAVSACRCICGGRASLVSEGSVQVDGRHLRVAHAECLECEEPIDLFFDLGQLLH